MIVRPFDFVTVKFACRRVSVCVCMCAGWFLLFYALSFLAIFAFDIFCCPYCALSFVYHTYALAMNTAESKFCLKGVCVCIFFFH